MTLVWRASTGPRCGSTRRWWWRCGTARRSCCSAANSTRRTSTCGASAVSLPSSSPWTLCSPARVRSTSWIGYLRWGHNSIHNIMRPRFITSGWGKVDIYMCDSCRTWVRLRSPCGRATTSCRRCRRWSLRSRRRAGCGRASGPTCSPTRDSHCSTPSSPTIRRGESPLTLHWSTPISK